MQRMMADHTRLDVSRLFSHTVPFENGKKVTNEVRFIQVPSPPPPPSSTSSEGAIVA